MIIAIVALLVLLTSLTVKQPAVDECNNMLFYSVNQGDATAYYTIDIASNQFEPFPLTNIASTPSWSPNGFTMAVAVQNADGSSNIYLVSDQGLTTLVGTVHATAPVIRWSPDNSLLAFETGRAITIIDLHNQKETSIFSEDGDYHLGEWSPDGEHIAITMRHENWSTLLSFNVEQDTTTALTNAVDGKYDYFVSWAPNSTEIYFNTNRFSDSLVLYKIN
ncbi:MAG: PD40 domain-containing protein [Chloroflexi bacterium]|nr:PD40 domain-containing protein [Chloroflexota bacterium]